MSLKQEIRDAKTEDDAKTTAVEGIRKIIDDTFIPLISEKRVSLTTYGDICFALGYLGESAKA